MNRTNCKNCGAPLRYDKDKEFVICEYCGTEYEFIPTISDFRQVIKFYIGGRVRKFYIGEVECVPIYCDTTLLSDYSPRYTLMHDEFKISLISYD